MSLCCTLLLISDVASTFLLSCMSLSKYSIHILGGIVALGKFDALHIGHRELALHASKAGSPFLLSFAGIAGVLWLDV